MCKLDWLENKIKRGYTTLNDIKSILFSSVFISQWEGVKIIFTKSGMQVLQI